MGVALREGSVAARHSLEASNRPRDFLESIVAPAHQGAGPLAEHQHAHWTPTFDTMCNDDVITNQAILMLMHSESRGWSDACFSAGRRQARHPESPD